jgi:pimeloyl-ACP methyl ester carboxylesterase
MIDIGTGPPLVLVPGLQGRWEWMRPTVDALAQRFRVLTFSLAGDKGSGTALRQNREFDAYVDQIDAALDSVKASSAAVCGVSFGALIAFHYAAVRQRRVGQLILASPMPPDFELKGRFRLYSRVPRLLFPMFVVDSARRVMPEWAAAFPKWSDRLQQAIVVGTRVLGAPASPARMGRRIRSMRGMDFVAVEPIEVPTLILLGESALDRTIPTDISRRYCGLIPHAEVRTLNATGHLGSVTRAASFANEVGAFVDRANAEGSHGRHDANVGA